MSSKPAAKSAVERIGRSALWAAYGDAAGFITELADAQLVRRRTGLNTITAPVPWTRRIGGRNGPSVTLPAGCVSDDTQLRLAVSRSIRGDGAFDVETFSKIELTAWPAYSLGAGRGTTAAAASLRRRSVTWAVNHFEERRVSYFSAGGNGAAMRVQPHVWSTRSDQVEKMVADVLCDAAATHGHPRGIFGALFHAQCLRHAFEHAEAPSPDRLVQMALTLPSLAGAARSHPVLAELWVGQWEAKAGVDLVAAAELVSKELQTAVHLCSRVDRAYPEESYVHALDRLDARNPAARGSGTKTSLLAALACWLMGDQPREMVALCANELGTDTDTIASMAGAISGANAGSEPDGELMDRDYLLLESRRMARILEGRPVASFPYPDMLDWSPPKTASDTVGEAGSQPAFAGLGPARVGGSEFAREQQPDVAWQWFDLWFGQHVIGKRRVRPRGLSKSQRVAPNPSYLERETAPAAETLQQTLVFDDVPPPAEAAATLPSLHEMTDAVIAAGFDPRVIGEGLMRAAQWYGIEGAVSFSSIVAKAQLTRLDRQRRNAQG